MNSVGEGAAITAAGATTVDAVAVGIRVAGSTAVGSTGVTREREGGARPGRNWIP